MSDRISDVSTLGAAVALVVAAALSAILNMALLPWLKRYALAKPNARSSHLAPTPQGGGIAVIAATVGAAGIALGFVSPGGSFNVPLAVIIAAAVMMACLGAIDDIRPLPVGPRLLLQAVVIAAAIYVLPDQVRIVPPLRFNPMDAAVSRLER